MWTLQDYMSLMVNRFASPNHLLDRDTAVRGLWDALQQLTFTDRNVVYKYKDVFDDIGLYETILPVQMRVFLNRTGEYYPQGLFKGAGIVMVAGGLRYFPTAYVSLRLLRRVNCTLPIEIWHNGVETPSEELAQWLRQPQKGLEPFAFRNIDRIAPGTFQKFGLKIGAILFSQFEKVLFIDADNHVLRNPSPLLQTLEFQQTGLLAWPDLWNYLAGRLEMFWKLVGRPELGSMRMVAHESGQLVIDKQKKWAALMLVLFWTLQHQLWYQVSVPNMIGLGDKEMFPLACIYLNISYTLIPYPPASAGTRRSEPLWLEGEIATEAEGLSLRTERMKRAMQTPTVTQTPDVPVLSEDSLENAFSVYRFTIDRCSDEKDLDLVQLSEFSIQPKGFGQSMYLFPRRVTSPSSRRVHRWFRRYDPMQLFNLDWDDQYVHPCSPKPTLLLWLPAPFQIEFYGWYRTKSAFLARQRLAEPMSWTFEGSLDGRNFVVLHRVCNFNLSSVNGQQAGLFPTNGETLGACDEGGQKPNLLEEVSISPLVNLPEELRPSPGDFIQANTQLQHDLNGNIIFVHRNCFKASIPWALDPTSPTAWDVVAYHNQSNDILFKNRASLSQGVTMFGRSECRFQTNRPDMIVPFTSILPPENSDFEHLIRGYLRELYSEPTFQREIRRRKTRFGESL